MTNGLLLQYHTEISKLQNSVVMYLLEDRLTAFLTQYGVAINILIEKRDVLQKEYFVFDGDNIKKDGEKFIMLEGKTYDEFMIKFTELMDEKVSKPVIIYNA